MNYEELKDWCADARRSVEREKDRLQGTQKGRFRCAPQEHRRVSAVHTSVNLYEEKLWTRKNTKRY